jgi:2'-5' RNA ligase
VRLFVALDLPDAVREGLAAWQAGCLSGRAELRAVGPNSLHVTLAFLGHLPADSVPGVSEAVAGAVPGLAAPSLRAVGVVGVPRRRPRLFAVDLADDGGRAASLQAAVSEALAVGGWYTPERRPFWPHVTVARVRARGGSRVAAPPFAGVPDAPFPASAVTLYRSRLGGGGPARYEALERVGL